MGSTAKRLSRPAGWGAGLHEAIEEFLQKQGRSWRLVWVDDDEHDPHYAWQHRERPAGENKAAPDWVTKGRYRSLAEFARAKGIEVGS